MIVLLSFLFGHLYCLSFFYLRLQITSLFVSSNISYRSRCSKTGKWAVMYIPRQESEWKTLFQDRKVSGHVYTKTGKWAVMYIHICKGYWLLHLFQRFFYRILELFWQWYFCFRFITIYICTEGNYLFKIWCLFYIFVFVGRTLTSKTVLLVVTSFRWPLFVL